MGFGWSSIGGSLPAVIEQMSESPTHTPSGDDGIQNEPGLTPGGLEPTNNVPTLGKMQAGSFTAKLVVAIEGCPFLLSDAPQASVRAAWADASGGDWASATVLEGLFVELTNSQSITPDDPLPSSGRCVVRLLDVGGSDEFGIFVNKRTAGSTTSITATADRNDTTISVASTANFDSSGTIYIGTEAIAYTGKTATSFTGCVRGTYSPFGCASSGSGGTRFGNHHRVATDIYHTQNNPTVSEVPRVWLGKRIGVWLHTWDAETEQLNTKKNAQLIYAGRIAGLADDPDTMATVIDVEHESAAFKQAVIGKDIWAGELAKGLYLAEGRTFTFKDWKQGTAVRTANALTVVASGASGANQMNAGRYSAPQICEALSNWLASEAQAARIYGGYTWASPVSSNLGMRTKCYFYVSHASDVTCSWELEMPGEVSAFLGMTAQEPGEGGMTAKINKVSRTNFNDRKQGEAVPFETLVFRPTAPGRLGQEFATESMIYAVDNERGTFVDQRSLLPSSIKESCPEGSNWGLFLLDDKVLMVGSYASNQLVSCWIAPFQLTADTSTEALGYIGRRADEPPAPVTLRQVFLFEDTFANILNALVYSTGASGHNHATHDRLAYGLGIGVPGSLLPDQWERSIANLPGAQSPIAVVIDEPTKFSELLRDDLRLRRAFVRWKSGSFEVKQWRTPLVANADITLTEANKAGPAGQQENHRVASQETTEWFYPVVKIDYAKDFAVGRNAQFLKSISIEDQTAVDDAGTDGRTLTLKMRNTYPQFAATGAAVEELAKDYLVGMPMFSRPARQIVRSIDLRYFEGVSVGDIAIVEDSFARDPLTGMRTINSRAAFITRHTYDLGGPSPNGGVRQMSGEVELFFLDTQRGSQYAPAANVDHEANLSGFSAGYNSTTSTIWCKPHVYSHIIQIQFHGVDVSVGEQLDAQNFAADDECVLVEIDPADPASPTMWTRTISSVNGNLITFTSGLSSPAWDATKRYRLTYAPYASCTTLQQDKAFQADDADEMVQDVEVPYHFSADEEKYDYSANTTAIKGEFMPDVAAGDGKPMDAGYDYGLAATSNTLIDYKTAHQAPCLWAEYTDRSDTSTDWHVIFIGPVFFGTEHLTATVTRSVTVAPWFRSHTNATDGSIRVTLSRQPPVSGAAEDIGPPGTGARFADHFSQATWTTTSSTWQTGEDKTLSLGCKDLFFGYAWITVERNGNGQSRGLAKLIEGPRAVNE